jgi:hypothetical protein
MKKLLLLAFCGAALQAQTVVTNIVYVTNTVAYTQPAPVVVQQPPTVVYESAPVIVSPVFVPGPYYYYYPRPVVSIGIGFRVGGYHHYHR